MWIETDKGEMINANSFLEIHTMSNCVLGYLLKPYWLDEIDCYVTVARLESCEEAEIYFKWLKIKMKDENSNIILFDEFMKSKEYFKFKGELDDQNT